MSLVLVVDDAPDTARITAVMLQIFGFETYEAMTGKEAIDLVSTIRFDAVLLDVRLPDVSGLEVARFIRRMHGERPRIIALTGLSGRTTRVQCLDAGCDYYLLKPFDLRKIRDLLPLTSSDPPEIPNLRMRDEEVLLG